MADSCCKQQLLCVTTLGALNLKLLLQSPTNSLLTLFPQTQDKVSIPHSICMSTHGQCSIKLLLSYNLSRHTGKLLSSLEYLLWKSTQILWEELLNGWAGLEGLCSSVEKYCSGLSGSRETSWFLNILPGFRISWVKLSMIWQGIMDTGKTESQGS